MYKVLFSNRFEKDIALCLKRGLKAEKLYHAIELLRQTGTFEANRNFASQIQTSQTKWQI